MTTPSLSPHLATARSADERRTAGRRRRPRAERAAGATLTDRRIGALLLVLRAHRAASAR